MEQVQTIIEQMGGYGIRGALVYVGASHCTGKQRPGGGYPNPSKVRPDGLIDYETGLCFSVNGEPGRGWRMLITYEPSDTYTVRLIQMATPPQRTRGIFAEILDSRNDVYCDVLQEVVERMYDRAIQKHNDGFIPLN